MRKFYVFLLIILFFQMGCENNNPDIIDLVSGFNILSQDFITLPGSEFYFVKSDKTVKEMKVVKDSERFHSEEKFYFDDNQNLIERTSVSDGVPIDIKYLYKDGILIRRDYYVNGELLKKSSYEINVLENTNELLKINAYRMDKEEVQFSLSCDLDLKNHSIHWYKKESKHWSDIVILYDKDWTVTSIIDKSKLFSKIYEKEITLNYLSENKILEYEIERKTIGSTDLNKYIYVDGILSEINYYADQELRTRDLLTEHDDRGNWITMIANPDSDTITITREIIYY